MHKLGLASLGGPEELQGTEGNPRSQRIPGIPRVPRDPPPPLLHEAKYIPFNCQLVAFFSACTSSLAPFTR